MAFSFGFSGDDIDIDDSEIDQVDQRTNTISSAPENEFLPEPVEPRRHEMGEFVPTLPSQISYNKLQLTAQTSAGNNEDWQGTKTKSITLARREVFDIRAQLMAEDSAEQQEDNEELIFGLEHGDIKPNFYEGGFKTWECALDLARLVVSASQSGSGYGEEGDWHVIELGAGTAIPSLALFAQLLSSPGTSAKRTRFTFADYNAAVLRLVTLPNLLLTWNHLVNQKQSPAEHDPEQKADEGEEEEDEELDISPELLETFQQDLNKRGIAVDFVSGAWSPAFVDLVSPSPSARTLILASETIYSPTSLGAFSDTLLALLRRSTASETSKSRALVAAKKVYFGVGGGVDEFFAVLRNTGGDGVDVKNLVDVKSVGVGRVVLEVTV